MFAHITPTSGGPSPVLAAFLYALSAVCALGFALYLWWWFRAGVIGDADGLRVRQFGGWKPVRWEDVSDYYESVPLTVQRSARTSQGQAILPLLVLSILTTKTKIEFTNRSSQAEALKALVTQNAIKSRSGAWETFGTRTIDLWPQVFDYQTQANRWGPRLWLKIFIVFLAYALIQPALQMQVTAHLIGWSATLVTAGLYLLLVGPIGLFFLLPLAQYREVSRRKSERITADLDGIVFENGTQRLETAWADVIGYGFADSQGFAARCVVETTQGAFDFLSALRNAAFLREIIRRFADQSADTEWRIGSSAGSLGGEAARWSSGKVGIGARVYHYRTRMNRIALSMPLVFCLVFPLMAGLAWQGLLPGANAQNLLLFGIISGLGFLFGWYAYRIRRIECSENGLTQRMVFGRGFLAWEQVQEFEFSRTKGGKVVGRGQTLRFAADIVGCAELTAEIERRVERTKATI